MKKIINILTLAAICFAFTSCGKKSNSPADYIEYTDSYDTLCDDADKAVSEEYNNFTIADDITLNISDYGKSYKFINNYKSPASPNDEYCKELIELQFDMSSFDKQENHDDDIYVDVINKGEISEAYCLYNYTKHRYGVFGKYGKVTVGNDSDVILEALNEPIKSVTYINNEKNVKLDDDEENALAVCGEYVNKYSAIMGDFTCTPKCICRISAENGEEFYAVYYEQNIQGIRLYPFGMEEAENQSEDFISKYLPSIIMGVSDSNGNFRYFTNQDTLVGSLEEKSSYKIAKLSTVLEYVDEVLATEYHINISNISYEYTQDYENDMLYPSWIIDLKTDDASPRSCNRIIVNAVDGTVSFYFDKEYYEFK